MKTYSASNTLAWFRRLMLLTAVYAGSAQAAVYVGNWDPPFGAPFSNLGWSGTAEYFVPDTCEPVGNAFVWNHPSCAGQARVTSAQVELHNLTSSESINLIFNPNSLHVVLMQFVGGDLSALLTDNSNFIDPSVTLSGAFHANTEFSLFFDLTGPHLLWRECSSYGEGHSWAPRCIGGVNSSAPGFRPVFTINRVPEPNALWLAGLGLVALAVPRRLRARR